MDELKFVCFDCVDENGKLVLHRYESSSEIIAAQCGKQSKLDMEKFMKRVGEWPN